MQVVYVQIHPFYTQIQSFYVQTVTGCYSMLLDVTRCYWMLLDVTRSTNPSVHAGYTILSNIW